MRDNRLFGVAAALMASVMAPFLTLSPLMPQRGRPKRRNRTGVTYPFSSKRQNARYARQIAAGKLAMAGIMRGAV